MQAPMAAVAVVCRCPRAQRFVLVRRGTPPNKGQWSLPGGRIELGERTVVAATRELEEETGIAASSLAFTSEPFATSDVIIDAPDVYDVRRDVIMRESLNPLFHYVISQVYCETPAEGAVPLRAGDDAMGAEWFSFAGLAQLIDAGELAPPILSVVERAEALRAAGGMYAATAPGERGDIGDGRRAPSVEAR